MGCHHLLSAGQLHWGEEPVASLVWNFLTLSASDHPKRKRGLNILPLRISLSALAYRLTGLLCTTVASAIAQMTAPPTLFK